MMTGAAPPCSSEHLVPGASMDLNGQPTFGDPANVRNATLGSVASFSVNSLLDVTMTWAQPSGRPASRNISTKVRHDRGVSGAGLIIIGHPAAIAGAT